MLDQDTTLKAIKEQYAAKAHQINSFIRQLRRPNLFHGNAEGEM